MMILMVVQVSAENDADDPSNWEDLSKRQQKKMKKKLSQGLDDFNNSSEGDIPKSKSASLSNIISLFMNEVGHQYAVIIDFNSLPGYVTDMKDASGNNNPDNIPDDYQSTPVTLLPNDPHYIQDPTGGSSGIKCVPVLYDDDNNVFEMSPCNTKILTYPYVVKPEWIFKYFVYNLYNDAYIDDKSAVIPNQVLSDIHNCYNQPNTYINTTEKLCNQACDPNDLHNNWGNDERFAFYTVIKGAPLCWQSKGTDGGYMDQTDLPTCDSKTYLIDSANSVLENYYFDCSNQASQIKSALIDELQASCYTILNCQTATAPGQITMKQIDVMVQSVVKRCQDEVKSIANKLPLNLSQVCTPIATTGPAYGCDLDYPISYLCANRMCQY